MKDHARDVKDSWQGMWKTQNEYAKVECLSFQSVGTEFSDLEYIPRYGPPKFCLYQFSYAVDAKIKISSLAICVVDT